MSAIPSRMTDAERARNALHAISPDIERAEWWRVCASAKAAGLDFDDFDNWSQGGQSYREADIRDTWKSTEANGGIGAGTLFDIAKQHGYQPGNNHAPARPAVTKATVAALNASRQAKRKAPDVAAFWGRCTPAESHPYIATKDGTPDGLRIVPDNEPLTIAGHSVAGWLVVPAYTVATSATSATQPPDTGGVARESRKCRESRSPQSLQFIPAPGQGKKLNMPGASMKGASFTVGQPNAGPVYVVEGIGQAWACHKATGRPAVVAFGWGNVRRVAGSLPGNVVLVPDTGKEADAGRIVADMGASVAYMPEGEPDNFDANDYAQREGYEALASLLEMSQKSQVSQPEPLRRPVPPPEQYPLQELGETLAPAAEAIRHVIQAPDAICGASILAAASLATQGQANVMLDGRVMPLSLWCLTVAESGERKSAVDSEAMRPIREHEKALAEAYGQAKLSHDNETEEWSARRDKAKGEAKKQGGAGLAGALNDIGAPPSAPLLPFLTASDFTAEGLYKLLRDGIPSMGAFTDEAALVFGGHGMTKETVTRTAGALSKLWDSGMLDRVRGGDGAGKLYGRRLALHLMAQPVIAEQALGDAILSGQGFLARCLLAWPEPTAGTRLYVAENLRDNEAVKHYNARILDLLERELPIDESADNELQPRNLTLSREAFAAWRDIHDLIERQIAPTGSYAIAKVWANKAAEQCLRIAGVLALVDNPDTQHIGVDVIERAAELAIWHLNEAVRLAGTAEISPEVRNAEALLHWCHDTGRELLHSRAALRLGPNCIRERKRFTEAMGELERAGWAYPVEGGAMVDDRHRRNVWRVVSEGC